MKKTLKDIVIPSEFDWNKMLKELKEEIESKGLRERIQLDIMERIKLKTIDLPNV